MRERTPCPRCGEPARVARSTTQTIRVSAHPCPHGIRPCTGCDRCWRLEAARHARDLLGIDDLLAPDDPYSVAGTIADACLRNDSPRAFVERTFATDLQNRDELPRAASLYGQHWRPPPFLKPGVSEGLKKK